ncbi:MAG: hypothetical protein IJF25_03470 [Oscillospiraceae bacterium]|nr:hypothetical protein [Oscillospiraceae bacterium]
MAEFVTPFEAEEGVTRTNFNSRIEQINAAVGKVTPDCGTEELSAGSDALESGKMYLLYE